MRLNPNRELILVEVSAIQGGLSSPTKVLTLAEEIFYRFQLLFIISTYPVSKHVTISS